MRSLRLIKRETADLQQRTTNNSQENLRFTLKTLYSGVILINLQRMRAFFAILVFSWILTLFLPWWGILVPGIIFGAWLLDDGITSFFVGFLGTGLAWLLQAMYIDIANDSILSKRIAEMMGMSASLPILLITFLIAAIAGGLVTLTGYFLKTVFRSSSDVAGA